MSLKASTWAWSVPDVTATERLLLLNLADFAAPHGQQLQHHCWPSQETLAERSCVSTRQVRTLLARLDERGLIRRERRSSQQGRSSDLYWLPVWEGSQQEETSGSATGSPERRNRKSSAPQQEVEFQGTVREPEEEPTPPAPPKGGRRSRMSATAAPSQQQRDDADRLAPGLDLPAEWVRFRDYHLAKGSLQADWAATWRTWLRRTDEFKRANDPDYGWR